jgi:hypothetical protein
MLITADLDRRGVKTSVPLLRWYFFRNLGLYREVTRRETGTVGALFYVFVVSINLAWILGFLAWVTR